MELGLNQIIENQKGFFLSGKTKDIQFRLEQLKRLKAAMLAYEGRFYDALWKDLHKSKTEAYMTEIGFSLEEIGLQIKKLRRWSKPVRVPTNQLIHFWSTSKIISEPYGTVLIIAPWNYPLQLLIAPL
ncbi:MAG: aldehyde dehydrogenase family protein, partial [Bacteroidota bacterium]